MIAVATIYRDLMDGDTNVGEADGKLAELSGDASFSNSFFYGLEGCQFTKPLWMERGLPHLHPILGKWAGGIYRFRRVLTYPNTFEMGKNIVSVNVNLTLSVVSPTDFGDEDTEMARYKDEGTARALAMDNRDPVRFGSGGKLNPAILDSYWKHGFYVFESVVSAEERKDIERDVAEIIERAPIFPNSKLDKHDRPAFGHDCEGREYRLTRPLEDALGGTDRKQARHQVKMAEPNAPKDAPEWFMQVMLGPLQYSEACLRL